MALTDDQIIKALDSKGGFISQAAKDLGVTYQAIWNRIKKSDKITEAYQNIKESYLDMAESKLLGQVREGNLGAICFFLKCQGKQRGYVERADIDLNLTGNVTVIGRGYPDVPTDS